MNLKLFKENTGFPENKKVAALKKGGHYGGEI
jgi:hypothetical protein